MGNAEYMGIQSQADRRLKKSKPSYQRTNSQTFKMFDEAQIKEFKEIFGFLDQDGNGVIEVDDLVALHGIMGKPADEAALGAMIAEAPGPLDFQMLLRLFGEKMSGTDPEETIMAEVAQMFDQVKPAGGKFNYGKFTRIMKRGSDE